MYLRRARILLQICTRQRSSFIFHESASRPNIVWVDFHGSYIAHDGNNGKL